MQYSLFIIMVIFQYSNLGMAQDFSLRSSKSPLIATSYTQKTQYQRRATNRRREREEKESKTAGDKKAKESDLLGDRGKSDGDDQSYDDPYAPIELELEQVKEKNPKQEDRPFVDYWEFRKHRNEQELLKEKAEEDLKEKNRKTATFTSPSF